MGQARRQAMLRTSARPDLDTVIFDGGCRFCRGQIALLRGLDVTRRLRYLSLHDPAVAHEFPELEPEQLRARMYVVDRLGRARGGAEAVRYLTQRLPLLWPLALPLHVPGSLPLWEAAYGLVARHRYRIAGRCDDGSCHIG